MSNFFLTFNDLWFPTSKSTVTKMEMDRKEFIEISFYNKSVSPENLVHTFNMDKSAAIRFAKTLRTEINKIQ